MRILLVETEAQRANLIYGELTSHAYIVDHVDHLTAAKEALKSAQFAVLIVGAHLPDGDGMSLIASAKRLQQPPLVIMINGADRPSDAVVGLDAGADDYLAKAFDIAELMARMRARLRRAGALSTPHISCGRVTFDPIHRSFSVGSQALRLPRRELVLLEALMLRARRVVQRAVLINDVFGFEDHIQSNTLDSHVSRLRFRLAQANAGVSINPVRGVGYVLDTA